MIKTWMAYNFEQLENLYLVRKAKQLLKLKLISQAQFDVIQAANPHSYYTPSIAMKVLLFLAGWVGISTSSGPFIAISSGMPGMDTIRGVTLLIGIAAFLFNDLVLVRQKLHFKSGLTEALAYSSLGYIYFGLLGESSSMYAYLVVGLIFCLFVTIRYLDHIALIASITLLSFTLFQFLNDLGGMILSLIPIIFMVYSLGFIYLIYQVEKRIQSEVFDSLIQIFKTCFLMLLYLAGNYFVVRELSIELLGLELLEGENIPFYFIFYITTALFPMAFLFFGIKDKSLLLIRVGLLCIALSFITLKYYFSLAMPMVTITISGAILILLSIGLMRYLKSIRFGFTRNLLLTQASKSDELATFIISQTAGGTTTQQDKTSFGGGKFGGGGAGSEF